MTTKFSKLKAFRAVGVQTVQHYLRIGVAKAPKYINLFKEHVIYKKANDLNNLYTRLLGLDEVRIYQERVVTLQDKLLGVQERRRAISQQLTEIRRQSTDLQEQLHKVKRSEELQRFLDLMREETEVLKLEKSVIATFVECDREEREIFTAFTNAIRDSHEKQRAQLEYTKYLGLILSIFGSFLTFCYSSLRKRDLKQFIQEKLVISSPSSEPLFYITRNQQELKILNKLQEFHRQVDLNSLKSPPKLNKDVPEFNTSKIITYACVTAFGIFILNKIFS